MKRVLYNHWNYLSDKRGISSPDGGATYLPWILEEFNKRGWRVYCSVDKDKELVEKYGIEAFSAFSKEKRWKIYNKIKFLNLDKILNQKLPEIDLLICEWRFPTKDNSLFPNELNYSPDLKIQEILLNSYKYSFSPPKIIIFDLDYKFLKEDRKKINPWKVLEQGINPKPNNKNIFIPMDIEEMRQFPTLKNLDKMVYVGNDYNRREDIEKKLIPFSNNHPQTIKFYGNWLKDSQHELRRKWKNIEFNGRVGFNEFREIYSQSTCYPLLAPQEYKERGHMTARILEGLMFGSIPIGWRDFIGIEKWLPNSLIIDENNPLEEVYDNLLKMSLSDRIKLRESLIDKLEFHDVRKFVDVVLKNG